MASRKVIGARHHEAMIEVTEILQRLDPEATNRVAKANHGPDHGIPSPTRRVPEALAFHAEILRSLARLLDGQMPKKRGRPPKSA
jgi:hypothetical protein